MRCCNIIMKNQILVYIFFGLYSFVRWNIIVTTERVSGREKKKKKMDKISKTKFIDIDII